MRLNDKVAIVTGGASGFGAGIVRKFCGEGARVLIADLNADMGQALADELGDAAAFVQANVADAQSVQAMADAAVARFGSIDILVITQVSPTYPPR